MAVAAADEELIRQVLSEQKNILQIVELLGAQLMSSEYEDRKPAMNSLVNVLEGLPKGCLAAKEVVSLLTFLMAKVNDHHVVVEVLRGLVCLVNAYNADFSSELVQSILTQLFRELDNQSLAQAQRFHYYTILERFMYGDAGSSKPALLDMGHDFVFGFIQSMDGEKDPRSLVLVFQLAATVAADFDIKRFVEELFEVVACYFPIDFTPPSNDPHGITREQLVSLNRAALCASPLFAPLLLPLVLEKAGVLPSPDTGVASQSGVTPAVRREVLLTVSALASANCPPELLHKFEAELSACLRRAVFVTPDEGELDADGPPFQCCAAVTTCLAGATAEALLAPWVARLLREARPYLLDVQGASFMAPARALVVACAHAAPCAAAQVLSNLVPLLLAAVQERCAEEQRPQRRALLDALCVLLREAVTHDAEPVLVALLPSKEALLDEAVRLSQPAETLPDVTLCALGYSLLGHLLAVRALLTDAESARVVALLAERLLAVSSDADALRDALISAFVRHASAQPMSVPVQAALCRVQASSAAPCVAFLAQLGGECDALQPQLTRWFCAGLDAAPADAALWRGLEQLVRLAVLPVESRAAVSGLLWPMLRTTVLTHIEAATPAHSEAACAVIRHLVAAADAPLQRRMLTEELRPLIEGERPAALMDALAAALRPEVALTLVAPLLAPALRRYLLERPPSLGSFCSDLELRAAVRCAALVNKSVSRRRDDEVAQLLVQCLAALRSGADMAEDSADVAADSSNTADSADSVADALAWRPLWTALLCRALLLAGHPAASDWLALLLDQAPTAESIGCMLLLGPLARLRPHFAEPVHALRSCVATQRALLQVATALQTRLDVAAERPDAAADAQACQAAAHLGQLLADVDEELLVSALASGGLRAAPVWLAAPRLLRAAAAGADARPVLALLRLLLRLLAAVSDATVLTQLPALIPRLLQLVADNSRSGSSTAVRVLALELLERCVCTLSVQERRALRGEVLCALKRAVDDGKRAVRREAMRVRNRWYLLETAE